MEFEKIIKLVECVSASGLTSFQYESGGEKIILECKNQDNRMTPVGSTVVSNMPLWDLQAKGQTLQSQPVVPSREDDESGNIVKSPLVGTFYSASSEEADDFVSVGDHVKKGQILAIVEAMKLMNEIESDFEGEVAEIYVKNHEAVEYGQPLFRIV
ncbi:acetyl-CoA carboxylase biotin carboxyl carrier protein [Blautia liquoris]|uniref:Biotin carboxyl carrier protein of acetyl-CoA carboxylase n=1 Tax=Blautia liquoris TaxID=2779518 RepID=A0A7M2RJB3_9FIRM|nr:acetyl-CoA carboxylase biotin carboxyl carrier protein [Blautia liquoris]QOV19442.1 acetyl-CoA carboxylase biotin carboxyl carrier protein [Blautia liquoris]